MMKPMPGDQVHMPWDDDVMITIDVVPEDQPYRNRDAWVILDQYGDEHAIEAEGNHWITLSILDL
jgi:hypothetical protein